MNIASGHIYNGDYLKAKSILDNMPRDRSGEVQIIKKMDQVLLFELYLSAS